MPVVPLKEIVDRAFAERYGVAAINVVNDLTLEAVLAAAVEQHSPVIVQTSVKTVRAIGTELLFAMWRELTAGIEVPVSLHLDHCPDRSFISGTEWYGHLVAFNQTFAEFGLPVRWSPAEYRAKLRIGGGKERMASLLTPEFVAVAGLPADPAGQQAAIADWHRRKTEIYTGLVASGAVPPRPGVARVVAEALAAGWLLAVASTSAEASVRAPLPAPPPSWSRR
ncbi:MAG TPA: class II fructose-bisphosphate aldolase [Streptosporangiaceae bacterium]|nr:class II fructose-bisphosphate aldolase [Streptosporangiaceae bacterium]